MRTSGPVGFPPADTREQYDAPGRRGAAALCALHEIPRRSGGRGDWDEFVRVQEAGCVERQRARGLDGHWLEQIPDFLDSVDLGHPERVLAHTEVMSAHPLVDDGRLTGLVDFEPAMRAAREYEFVATGIFPARGDREVDRALHRAYGRDLDPRTVLACALLRVYSNLPWYAREVPTPARTVDDLAEHWFGHWRDRLFPAPVRGSGDWSARTMDDGRREREAHR